jgi:ribosomal protein S18 acetylase RimI-like enzyme
MRLSVDVGNDEGLGFYGRLGFTTPNEQTLVLEGANFAGLARQ